MQASVTSRLPGLSLGRPLPAYRRAVLRSRRPVHIAAAAASDAMPPQQPGGGGGGGKATPESLGRVRQVRAPKGYPCLAAELCRLLF